jgi:putative ABC transport system permease protein
MLQNYLKIALRNLLRHKAFSFINIAGLATGMACSILMLLWVQDELSYDRFHARADSIYRLTAEISSDKIATTSAPLAAALQAEMPEVKNATRLFPSESLFDVVSRKFEEKRVLYADSTFLQVFSFPLVKGDARTALSRPDGVLLTEEMARKYFGSEEALGQTIRMDNQHDFTVTGVLQNVPANSHLQFDFLLPMSFLVRINDDLKNNVWSNFNFFTYVQLHERLIPTNVSLGSLEQRITELFAKNEHGMKASFQLQPLTRVHLHSKYVADVEGHGNIQNVRIFSVVAAFILLIACINFMNLATARSARRAKEVGLRKVIGALRGQLIGQFLGESLLISFLALVLAIILVEAALPAFNDLSGKALSVSLSNGKIFLGMLFIAFVTGLVSGSYSALFLSGFQPVQTLKGGTTKIGSGGSVYFRNGLVVLQFVVSIVLIVGTAVVYKQLQFIRSRNLGYDKENLLYVPLKGDLAQNYQALRTELEQNPTTSDFTFVSSLPTGSINSTLGISWDGKDPQVQPIFSVIAVDEDFTEIFKMQMASGRSFSKDFKADTANYVVNEKALEVMGMEAESAIGKQLTLWGTTGTIIGVVKDFNFKPVQQPIEPLILILKPMGGFAVVRTKPNQLEAAIADLENSWQKLNPAYPFSYDFVDQDLARLYKAEQRMGRILNAFAALAIFISCLGLYGLAAFMAERRTKEIGVRKVLGASVASIIGLLSKDFVKLVGVAFVIATPLAWYGMSRWLEDYVYRIDLEWWVFVLAGLLALLIALLTVSFQSVKAALMNPVKTLRRE